MKYEINIKRTLPISKPFDPIGEVCISGVEAEGALASLFVYEDGGKGFFFLSDAKEQDYPLLMKKMLDAWNGDRPSLKTDENFTLGDA
jgi:hypothetical protein